MQQAAVETSASDSSFAGLLASLAAPPRPARPDWNDDLLADDIATFSYEQSLRAQAHHAPLPEAASESQSDSSSASASPESTLKRASITIRLSQPECAQLRLRAAEAGLTVSAYLRSCAFEVESLRTQVKQTLAQLREPAPARTAAHPSRQKPWFRFWPFGRRLP